MPQRRSAEKTLRIEKKRRITNLAIKKTIKETTKKYLKALVAKDAEHARQSGMCVRVSLQFMVLNWS